MQGKLNLRSDWWLKGVQTLYNLFSDSILYKSIITKTNDKNAFSKFSYCWSSYILKQTVLSIDIDLAPDPSCM